ncbi:hypothetical protein BGV40_02500 [Methanosarcina sp. Ant1]|nr:hypothetical protein BGV40_02500 [Methanosarcina sp. Ant1]
MDKLKFDRIKKTMAILLIALFVMSVTAASVSAKVDHKEKAKAKYMSNGKNKYSSAANIYVPTNIQTIVAVNVQPTVVVTTVVNVLSPGDTTVGVHVKPGIINNFNQKVAST